MHKLLMTVALSAIAMPSFADDSALLLGVERYRDLRRVIQGADVVQADDALGDVGYDVQALANGDADEMGALLSRFASDAVEANRLVVAMSGRFATDGTRTWYLAADAKRPSLFGLATMAVSLESVMEVMAATPGQSVLVLGVDLDDDDRLDPYIREGIGEITPPQGVTVIYGDARYVEDFVTDVIPTPGANLMEAVRDSRRLRAVGYQPATLVMQAEGSTPPSGGVVAPPVVTVDRSLSFWIEAQEANTADGYRDFVFRFPNSSYASEARRRLDAIESDPNRIDRLAEERLKLSRNSRREIQRDLTLLGYDTRGVDGIFGPGSRQAIRNWQQSNGFNQSSYLTAEQISRIDAQATRRAAELEAEKERQREQELRLDRAYWEETGARGDEAGYRAYLERYPNGIFAEEATNQLAQYNGRDVARAEEQALAINPFVARLVESRLEQQGFEPGQVDGRFDADTRAAIRRYQRSNNLPSTGYLNQPTVARLLADAIGR